MAEAKAGRPRKAASMRPDFASLGGLLVGVGGIIVGLLLEGGKVKDVSQFTAALLVFGGTLGAVMVTTPMPVLLRAAGKRLFVHTVITGGQALADTLNGFGQLAESTSDQNIVVWVNEYFGRVERDGKQFLDMKVFEDNAQKVCGTVAITRRNQDTFGRDIEDMVSQKLTFDEAIRDGHFTIMTKQRLRVVQRDLFEQLDRMPLT